MASNISSNIITDSLILCLDAANDKSYINGSATWFDLSTNLYSGTLTNGPVYNSANGGSIVFDGVNDYVLTGTVQGSSNFTICVWCKVNYASSTTYGRIVEKGFNSEWTLCINKGVTPATKFNFQYFDNGNLVTSSVDVDSSNYQFLTVTVNDNGTSTTGSFYVNGILNNSGSRAVTVATKTGTIAIGSAPSQTSIASLSGSIANVYYYNRILSVSEILQNYNSQKSRFGL